MIPKMYAPEKAQKHPKSNSLLGLQKGNVALEALVCIIFVIYKQTTKAEMSIPRTSRKRLEVLILDMENILD